MGGGGDSKIVCVNVTKIASARVSLGADKDQEVSCPRGRLPVENYTLRRLLMESIH